MRNFPSAINQNPNEIKNKFRPSLAPDPTAGHGGGNRDVKQTAKEFYKQKIEICEEESWFVVDQNIKGKPMGDDQEYIDNLNDEKFEAQERLNRLQSKD